MHFFFRVKQMIACVTLSVGDHFMRWKALRSAKFGKVYIAAYESFEGHPLV